MTQFVQHTLSSAPAASRPVLEGTKKALGFVPNLFATFAESPAALNAYAQVAGSLDKDAALSAVERHLVAIFISRENNCEYCVAAHTALGSMAQAAPEVIQAARNGGALGDAKLEALRRFSVAVTEQRGQLKPEQIADFIAAGYSQRHALDVITVAALKTLSNYTNHLAETPLDEQFEGVRWQRAA